MPEQSKRLIDVRHPEHRAWEKRWRKFRLVYEGGQPFKDMYLRMYSRRELPDDYRDRKEITYNPGDAKAVVNIVRNALAWKSVV